MMNFLISIFLSFYKVNYANQWNEILEPIVNMDNETLEIGISNNYHIEYKKYTNFTFKINDDDIYQINIHSFNCNFDIYSNGRIINQINLETYSLKIKKESKSVIIKPIIDIIDGREKENYELQRCHLSINSFKKNQPQIIIKNNEETIFYFDYNDSKSLNVSYELKDNSNYNYAALFFQFNEKCNFLINIGYNDTQKFLISKNIFNSSYLYLSSNRLNNFSIDNSKIYLNIIIKKIDNDKEIKMGFKIIEKEIISILQKNALNYGFITTKIKYQYFYLEIFKGKEGEIMYIIKDFMENYLQKLSLKKN